MQFRDIIASAMRSLAISLTILLASLLAQQTAPDPGAFDIGATQGTGSAKQSSPAKAGPAPHFANGLPDFGGSGAWYPGFSGNIAETKWKGVKSADVQVDVPFLPAALELFNQRVTSNSKDDPEAQCLPVGVPRYMFDPYAFQMVQTPKQVIFCSKATTTCGEVFPFARIWSIQRMRNPRGWVMRSAATKKILWWWM